MMSIVMFAMVRRLPVNGVFFELNVLLYSSSSDFELLLEMLSTCVLDRDRIRGVVENEVAKFKSKLQQNYKCDR